MISNFLSLMLFILRSFTTVFILPLGFIVLCLCVTLFNRMGGFNND